MPRPHDDLLEFPPFRLDRRRQQLRHGDEAVALRPKTWAVLCRLVAGRGALVGKAELLDAVWGDVAVSEDTLTQSIRELRQALGDDARRPRYIETVHGRGFRFVAALQPATDSAPADPPAPPALVGRDSEAADLAAALAAARRGARQTVFLTGDAGVGKSALVDALLAGPLLHGDDVVGTGRCIPQYGPREGFLPLLDALERAFTSPAGRRLLPDFRRLAPTWVTQLPRLAETGDAATPANAYPTATPMLRELAAALEAVACEQLLILVLEDLHWSDPSTLDLVALLARRPEPARLLLVGTYRQTDAAVLDHPVRDLMRDLRTRRLAREVRLRNLSAADVAAHVAAVFGLDDADLVRRLAQHTEGNPLFLHAVLDDLVARGWLAATARGWEWRPPEPGAELPLPENVLDAIVVQLRRLTTREQAVLEAASVAGEAFVPPPVAAAADLPVAEVESACSRLADHESFLVAAEPGAWPGSDPTARFAFRHALYRRAIQAAIPASRRRTLQRRIGEAIEAAWGDRVVEVSGELADHFDRAGDRQRAIRYLGLAAGRLVQRYASREALTSLDRALELLADFPDDDARRERELELRSLRSLALYTTNGFAAPPVQANLERVRALCAALGGRERLFEAEFALWYARVASAECDATWSSVAALEHMAGEIGDAEMRRRAGLSRGFTEVWSGEIEAAIGTLGELAAGDDLPAPARLYGADPNVSIRQHFGLALWAGGFPDRALGEMRNALARAENGGTILTQAGSLAHNGHLELQCGNLDLARDRSLRAQALAVPNGLAFFALSSRFVLAATDFASAAPGDPRRTEAIAAMEGVIDAHRENGTRLLLSAYYALLGDACAAEGRFADGLRHIGDGLRLAETGIDRLFLADLWRVRAALLQGQGADDTEVTSSLDEALAIARRQGARSLELRTATTRLRLASGAAARKAARIALASVCDSFTEGHATRDWRAARDLLDATA